MNWNFNVVEEAKALYATMNAHQIAEVLSERYQDSVTHDDVRNAFSRHNVKDPKGIQLDKDKELAVKYRVLFRWFIHEIAEQLERSPRWVKMTLCKARKAMQSTLRIVRRKPVQLSLFPPCVQLDLPFVDAPVMSVAA